MQFGIFTVGDVTTDPTTGRTPSEHERIRATAVIDNYNFEDRKLIEIVKATYFDPKVVVVIGNCGGSPCA